MFQIIHKKIISAVFSPALSSTSRLSQSGSVTNFLKYISQNTILLQSEILFWHNMKIRLWRCWPPFFTAFLLPNAHNTPRHEAVTQVQVERTNDPITADQELFWTMGKQHLSRSILYYSQEKRRRETSTACSWNTSRSECMSPNTQATLGLPSVSPATYACGSVTDPSTWTQKLLGPAHLVPGTTLHLLCWKAYNHFPWKDEKLCQFVCTLLQLRMIRCFQSVVLQ